MDKVKRNTGKNKRTKDAEYAKNKVK